MKNRRHFLHLGTLAGLSALSSCGIDPRGGTSVGGAQPRRGSQADLLGHKPGPRGFRTVILDAGHGGQDSGAVQNGLREKDLTLDIVQRVRQLLSNSFSMVLMRRGDEFIDLDERVVRASRYDDAVLVSVHFNSGPSHLAGIETFYWRVDSYGLATRMQRALSSVVPRQACRGLVRRRLRLTRNPTIPCVLVEGGYLSNGAEANLLRQAGYRDRLARAIAGALQAQAAQGDGNIGPLPPPRWDPPSRPTDARDSA
jgi:N-acetylmuramoyl-L-alanine amidase